MPDSGIASRHVHCASRTAHLHLASLHARGALVAQSSRLRVSPARDASAASIFADASPMLAKWIGRVQQVASAWSIELAAGKARGRRRLERRVEDGGKVSSEADEEVQFTFFGSDQADRFVTTSNCRRRFPIN